MTFEFFSAQFQKSTNSVVWFLMILNSFKCWHKIWVFMFTLGFDINSVALPKTTVILTICVVQHMCIGSAEIFKWKMELDAFRLW